MFGLWCNGSTTGFGSVCPGSNPGSPTNYLLKIKAHQIACLTGFCYSGPYHPYLASPIWAQSENLGELGAQFENLGELVKNTIFVA